MSFKRELSKEFKTEVTVNVPNNAGGFDANTFVAVFKRPMPVPVEGGGAPKETTYEVYQREHPEGTNKQFVRDWLVGWDMEDTDTGEKVPFNELELEATLLIEPTPAAVASAFLMAYRGIKTKN